MQNVSESLAGRIRILHLETLSAQELRQSNLFSEQELKTFLLKGGYPELWENQKLTFADFFSDYIQTYLEKDLKQIINVKNLYDFQRFLLLCASRIGQLINFADLSKDLGISISVVKQWLHALEIGGIIYLLPPYYNNLGKRLIKTPKLYFADHGLVNYLLNITTMENLNNSLFKGALWENFVFCELIKTQSAAPGREIFFYRDQNGVEIDFVLELNGKIIFIEAKAQELPGNSKLNFSKVTPLITHKAVECFLACTTNEPSVIAYKDYKIFNPLYCAKMLSL
jgi:predicted AAA+ superfamily ATPase